MGDGFENMHNRELTRVNKQIVTPTSSDSESDSELSVDSSFFLALLLSWRQKK
jgi:hypothetical protein